MEEHLAAVISLSQSAHLIQKTRILSKKHIKSDCNGTRTHNHLVRKRTFNHLTKLDFAPASSKEFLDIQTNAHVT